MPGHKIIDVSWTDGHILCWTMGGRTTNTIGWSSDEVESIEIVMKRITEGNEFAAISVWSSHFVIISKRELWPTTNGLMVPFWSIVVPLTLLSAWLLLSKPRPSVAKKSVATFLETVK